MANASATFQSTSSSPAPSNPTASPKVKRKRNSKASSTKAHNGSSDSLLQRSQMPKHHHPQAVHNPFTKAPSPSPILTPLAPATSSPTTKGVTSAPDAQAQIEESASFQDPGSDQSELVDTQTVSHFVHSERDHRSFAVREFDEHQAEARRKHVEVLRGVVGGQY